MQFVVWTRVKMTNCMSNENFKKILFYQGNVKFQIKTTICMSNYRMNYRVELIFRVETTN